jgi:transcriptional regulator with XRE-family HTH domain
MKRVTPEPWANAMVEAGAVDPRNPERASMSQLAKMAGVHTTTIAGLVFGDRETELQVIEQVARALKVGVETVSEWAGKPRTVEAPYTPPKEADLLNQRQRQALDELIKSITAGPAKDTSDVQQEVQKKTGTRGKGPGETVGQQGEVEAGRVGARASTPDDFRLAARRRLDIDRRTEK